MQQKRSYEDDLIIDENNLEVEWVAFPRKYMYWREREIEAQDARDRADRRRKVVEAEVEERVRANPMKYGLDKITEAAVRMVVLQSKETAAAEEEFLRLNKEARLLSSVVPAMENVRRALDNLVDLWIAGYYSSERGIPKEIKKARQERLCDQATAIYDERKKERKLREREKGE